MPVSVSWTVQPRRSGSAQASASTTMTASGCRRSVMARTSSADSTPVVPSTPGVSAATERKRPNCSGSCARRWRVTSTLCMASGPTASGVIARLPSPTTSTDASGISGRAARRSSERVCAAFSKASSARRSSGVRSSVSYRPIGLHNASEPAASSTSTCVTAKPRRCVCTARTPGSCAAAAALRRASASTARSVRGKIGMVYSFLTPHLVAQSKRCHKWIQL